MEEGKDVHVLMFSGDEEFADFIEGILEMAQTSQRLPYTGQLAGWVVKIADDPSRRRNQSKYMINAVHAALGPRQSDLAVLLRDDEALVVN